MAKTKAQLRADAVFEGMTEELQQYRRDQSKAYLQEIRKLCLHIRALEAEISEQREIAAGITGIDYSQESVATSMYRDAIPDAVAKLLEMISDTCTELAECAAMQDEARRCLAKMGGVEADVLILRYLVALPWSGVSGKIGYSVPRLKEIHRDALFCFYDYMPSSKRDPFYPAI